MPNVTSSFDRFQTLRAKIAGHDRIAGIYILDAAVPNADKPDAFPFQFAARLGFSEPDVGPEEWKHAEVLRTDARKRVIEALIGGAEIGHSRCDIEPAEAAKIADEFLALFSDDARFFCNQFPAGTAQMLAPYAHPNFHDHIFGGGCMAYDRNLAGVLWVLDND